MGKLNAARMRTLIKAGTYGDGAGLYLQVRGPSNRSWLYRFKLQRLTDSAAPTRATKRIQLLQRQADAVVFPGELQNGGTVAQAGGSARG